MFNVSARKIVVSSLAIAAPVAFSFGASSEAWGGHKTVVWEKGHSTNAKKTVVWEKGTSFNAGGKTVVWELGKRTVVWE